MTERNGWVWQYHHKLIAHEGFALTKSSLMMLGSGACWLNKLCIRAKPFLKSPTNLCPSQRAALAAASLRQLFRHSDVPGSCKGTRVPSDVEGSLVEFQKYFAVSKRLIHCLCSWKCCQASLCLHGLVPNCHWRAGRGSPEGCYSSSSRRVATDTKTCPGPLFGVRNQGAPVCSMLWEQPARDFHARSILCLKHSSLVAWE